MMDKRQYALLCSQLFSKFEITSKSKIKIHLLLWRKTMTNTDSILKSRDITLPTEVHIVKAMVFPVVIYGCELDHKESWVSKNWCFQIVVLEKTLKSPLDSKEIKTVKFSWRKSTLNIHWKDWSWSWSSNTLATWCEELIYWKRPWCWERLRAREGVTEDEMVGWHHRLDGH